MSINMILATGLNGELGCSTSPDGLPWSRNPEDMKFFKDMTTGNVVVYGGNTFRQFQKMGMEFGLPKRKNLVISNNITQDFRGSDVQILSLEDIIRIQEFSEEFFWVIGGESIYNQLHPYCDKIYLTRINKEFPEADVKMSLDFLRDFAIISTKTLNDYSHVEVWERKK